MEIERHAMALLLTTDEQAKLSKLLLVRRSIGNANRVGQRCVGQPEELRSEDQMTRENASGRWKAGYRIDRVQEQTITTEATFC